MWSSFAFVNHPQRKVGWVSSHGGGRFVIDFRDLGVISSLEGVTFRGDEGKVLAQGLLRAIEAAVSRGESLEAVVERYRPRSKRREVIPAFKRFVAHIDALVEAGDRSAKTAYEYRRILNSELGWWEGRSLEDLDYGTLEDWDRSLAVRGLSPKSRKNYLGALRSACTWLARRSEIKTIPPFPRIEIAEYQPTILPTEVVDFLIREIPEKQRGPYLVAAKMGLRPGEVRALDVSDIQRGGEIWRLSVTKAVQGPHSSSPIGPTKNRKNRMLPIHPSVREWLEAHVDWTGRLRRAPLFTNPVSHKRLSHTQFYDVWHRVRQGVTNATLYEGTKHSFASDALESGIDINRIRKFLGHSDPRSTEKYAKLSDKSLDVFARRK